MNLEKAREILGMPKIGRAGSVADFNNRVSNLKLQGREFYTVPGSYKSTIYYGGSLKVYYDQDKENKSLANICRKVSKDGGKFLKEKKIYVDAYRPIIYCNKSAVDGLSDGEVVLAVDMKSCYWNIAHNLGVLSASTYMDGICCEKDLRLMALGLLDKTSTVNHYKNGLVKHIPVKSGKADAWNLILKTVRGIFDDLVSQLGSDVLYFDVDCIYTKPKHITRLSAFFKKQNLPIRKLYYEASVVGSRLVLEQINCMPLETIIKKLPIHGK